MLCQGGSAIARPLLLQETLEGCAIGLVESEYLLHLSIPQQGRQSVLPLNDGEDQEKIHVK